MKPKLIRVRNRNQITLPSEMFEGVSPGDFLQARNIGAGVIELRVARIVPFGTRAAAQEEERAEAEIREGRSRVFSSPEALLESLSPAGEQAPASSVAETEPRTTESARSTDEEVLLPQPASASESQKDEELVRAAQRGDTSAFEALLQRYDRAVLRLALHLTGSQDEAQDLCQEAFLTAFRKIRTFHLGTSFYTWMYRIVTNACLEHLRERSHKPEDEVALAVNALESAQEKPEGSAPGLLTYAKTCVSSPRHRQVAKQCVIDYVAYGKEIGAPLQPEYLNGVRRKLIDSLEQSKAGVVKEQKADSA